MSAAAPQYDALVAGGGMVGASTALALAAGGLKVALLEAVPLNAPGQPSYDDRSIALSEGSRRILADLGLWTGLVEGVTPIEHIHVSDRGHFGAARMHAREEGVPALGYVVENRVLGQSLFAALASSRVELLCPVRVLRVEQQAEAIGVELDGEAPRHLSAAVLIIADGAESGLREQLGVTVQEKDYGQSAVIANVTPGRPHQGWAYERFTDSGPIAMLPMSRGRCSLVLTLDQERAAAWAELADDEFLDRLQVRFGHRLGRLRQIGQRAVYPLRLLQSVPQCRGRAVLLGNAARTMHPVAGQGFNLALRDLVALAESLITARREGLDPGAEARLQRWLQQRRRDQRVTVTLTDSLVGLFSNGFAPLAHARAGGLVALDLLPPLRHAFARLTMGLHGRRPAIAELIGSGRE